MEETTEDVDRRKNADIIIRNHIAWSMGAGLIPVPIADFFAVGAIQLDMIRQMCKLYDVKFSETDGRAIVSALTGSGLARLGTSAIKLIPGVGSVIGGVSMSVLSGASTYAVGELFKNHFETGGTILDFDASRLKKMYNEMFEKGKKVAYEMKEEHEKKTTEAPAATSTQTTMPKDDKIKKMQDLAQLRERGLLTEEEFNQLKKELIDN